MAQKNDVDNPPKKIKIKLQETDNENDKMVEIYLNGKAFVIERGKEVEVDPSIVEILDNAKKQLLTLQPSENPGELAKKTIRIIPSIPYSRL